MIPINVSKISPTMVPLMSWKSTWFNFYQNKNLLYLNNLRFKQLSPHCLASSIHTWSLDENNVWPISKCFTCRIYKLHNIVNSSRLKQLNGIFSVPIPWWLILLKDLAQCSWPSTAGTLVLICRKFTTLRMIKIMRTGWCDLLQSL